MSELSKEEALKNDLENQFKDCISNITIQRSNRVWGDLKADCLKTVAQWLKDYGFKYLSTITGFDEGDNLGAAYHFNNNSILLTLKVRTPRSNPELPSVLSIYPVSLSYELELKDMFGIEVENLPKDKRYPLPDNFPTDQHPLLKDWKQEQTSAEVNK